MPFFFIISAAVGAAIGSFLGVVIDRMEGSEPSMRKVQNLLGRSRCGSCRHQLAWWENIPIVSFILLRRRCRTCRSPIPYWLVLIELAGAAAGATIAMRPMSLMGLMGLILIATALIWIFFSDLVKGLVPDWAVALGSAGAIAMSLMSHMSLMAEIIAAAMAAAFFWLLKAVTRGRGMGPGDVTLGFFLGLWLGWPKIAVAVWLAFLLGAIAAIGLIITKRKKFGQTVPFGPFLIIGSLLAQQWGQTIVDILF